MKTHTIHITIFVFVLSIIAIRAQSADPSPADSMALDESIRYGRLPNGLTYYIKPISEPRSKLYLKLIVRAGGNQQDADQYNISHAVEHMAFRSSKNFPLGLPNDPERIGKLKMRNNKDFGGGNSTYFTVYYFDAPTDNGYALETCLSWFRDIANGSLNLKAEDIDKERGALLQEFILRNGGNKLNENNARVRLKSMIYPGTLDRGDFFGHNRNFRPEVLRRYYKDWYRPDLLAISIVGNINDVNLMEKRLQESFSDIVLPKNRRKWRDTDSIYYNQRPTFALVERQLDPVGATTDKKGEFHLIFRDPKTRNKIHTGEGLKRVLLWQMFTDAFMTRANNLMQVYNADFDIFANYLYPYKAGEPFAFSMIVNAEDKSERKGIMAAVERLRQFQEHGLNKDEWKEIKEKWTDVLDDPKAGNTDYWANAINAHFVFGEALPTNKQLYLKQWLTDLTLDGYNRFLRELIRKMPEDIGIMTQKGHGALSLTEKEVRSWIGEAWAKPTGPYSSPDIPGTLMPKANIASLKQGPVIDQGTGRTGARELVLANGVKLMLLPNKSETGSHGGKIKVHGFSPNGAACFHKKDYHSAINAPLIVRHAGVGSLDKFTLDRFLSRTSFQFGFQPYIDFRESGIKGEVAPEDLESMLELVYLYFTDPRKDVEAFTDWKRGKELEYQHPPYGLSDFDFNNSIKEVFGDSSFYNTGTKQFKGLPKIDLNRTYDIHRDLFGKARDFTFILNGNFFIDSILPLAQKYLGNLPNTNASLDRSTKAVADITLKRGPVFKKFLIPYDKKNISYALIFMPRSKEPFDWQENIKMELLGEILSVMVRPLRFDKGFALYSLNANGMYDFGLSKYTSTIKFDCTVEELPEIRKDVDKIITEMRSGKIDDVSFNQALQQVRSLYSSKYSNANGFIQKRLYEFYRYNAPWLSHEHTGKYLKSLSKEEIVEMANTYCRSENQYEFVMGTKIKMELSKR